MTKTGADSISLLHVLLIFLGVMAVYSGSLSNGFVWDDHSIIETNPVLAGWRNIPELLFYEDRLIDVKSGYYRPLTYLSFLLDRIVWGSNPFGFHLVNVALHTGITLLLYLLAIRITGDRRVSLLSAMFFGLHPVNAEAVNFLSGGRNTLLSGFFMLSAYLLHLRGRTVIAVLCYGVSAFTKEFGLLLPVLLVAHDRIISGLPLRLKKYLPYIVICGLYLIIRNRAVGFPGFSFDLPHLVNRIMLLPELVLGYLVNILAPLWLRVPYYIRPYSFPGMRFFVFLTLLLSIFLVIIRFRRQKPVVFPALWFFLFLMPVSNIIPLGYIWKADRYIYFSCMGLSIMSGYVLSMALISRISAAFIILLYCMFGLHVISLNAAWKNDFALYSRMVSDSPASSLGYHNLGIFYYEQDDLLQAQRLLEIAAERQPRLGATFRVLAMIRLSRSDPAGALDILKRAVNVNPGDAENLALAGRVYSLLGDHDQAGRSLADARKLLPSIDRILQERALGYCLKAEESQKNGKISHAERYFRAALLYNPIFTRALNGIGSVRAELGDLDAAIGYFRTSVSIIHEDPVAHHNLALAYRLKGMAREAEVEERILKELGGLPVNSPTFSKYQ